MSGDGGMTIEEAAALAERFRAAGRRIVLANGVFDLLHVGHIRYLESARSLGDVLFVGLNGDASVTRLKGRGRPIMPATERAELLTALRVVDYVVIFEDDNADALLRALRPDVHAKGTDYTESSVPERATAQALGARTAITGDPKSHATRDLIATIVERFGATRATP